MRRPIRLAVLIGFAVVLTAPNALAAKVVFEELIGVGEDGFSVGWQTDEPAPTRLAFGPLEFAPDDAIEIPGERTHHLIEVTGLDPDAVYFYRIEGADPATYDVAMWSPGWARTLRTPPGEFLFSFATVNDTHVGEDVAGLIRVGGLTLTPGFTWDDPDNPYWLFTNRSAVEGINATDAAFVIHKGDVTADADDWQYEDALDIFGELATPIYYARGNHDRIQHGEDYFQLILGITETDFWFDESGVRLVIVDSNDANGSGDVRDDQIDWLRGVLDEAESLALRVMIFAHHTFATDTPIYSVNTSDALALTELLGGYDNIAGMFAGHSHRASVHFAAATGDLPYAETPATKEYPMGYCVIRVYEGGYTQTFHRSACDECLVWSAMTQDEYFGFAPFLQFGDTADRSFRYVYPDWREEDAADDDTADDDTTDDDAASDDDTATDIPAYGDDDDDDDDGCGC